MVDFTLKTWFKIVTLTLLGFISILIIIQNFSGNEFEDARVRGEMIFARIAYSPSTISYVDDMGRTRPGTISWEKFNTSTLDGAINYESNLVGAAKVTLTNVKNGDEQTIYYNKEQYETWRPLQQAGLVGIGSPELYHKRLPVNIMKDGNTSKGILDVKVAVPE